MEGKISNVPLKHEAGLCLIVILKNNTLSSLKVFFATSVTWEDQLNVGDVILPLQAILEFIVHTDWPRTHPVVGWPWMANLPVVLVSINLRLWVLTLILFDINRGSSPLPSSMLGKHSIVEVLPWINYLPSMTILLLLIYYFTKPYCFRKEKKGSIPINKLDLLQ